MEKEVWKIMDFTELLNRGHKRYIEKHTRSRKLGRCEGCEAYAPLIEHTDEEDPDMPWKLCDRCYDNMIFKGDV